MRWLFDWINGMEPSVQAQWVESIGTLIAVITALAIAIFQDRMRSWFARPKLEVSVTNAPPDCLQIPIVRRDGDGNRVTEADSYHLRLKVTNTGNQEAESVEIFAAKLLRRHADGSYEEVRTFIPMNLIWADYRTVFFPAIHPDMYRYCALAHIIDPEKRSEFVGEDKRWPEVPPEKAIVSFETAVKPHTLSYLQPCGHYRLVILVAAVNAKPVEKVIEISLDGTWYNDEQRMFEDGVGVRLLESASAQSL
jgi:hypothetical protein